MVMPVARPTAAQARKRGSSLASLGTGGAMVPPSTAVSCASAACWACSRRAAFSVSRLYSSTATSDVLNSSHDSTTPCRVWRPGHSDASRHAVTVSTVSTAEDSSNCSQLSCVTGTRTGTPIGTPADGFPPASSSMSMNSEAPVT